jgi:hypothetical protein
MKLDEPARQHWDKAMERCVLCARGALDVVITPLTPVCLPTPQSIKESFGIPINGVTLSELPLREQV